jgi:hypothetical protein
VYRVKNLLSSVAGIAAILSLFAAGASANLITNSDFEAGNTGFTSDYTNSPSLYGEQRYAITTDPQINHAGGASYGDHTTGSGLMMAVNGSPDPGDVIWGQTISVAANRLHDFAVYISSWSTRNPAELEFSVNGFSIGGITPSGATGIWEFAFATWHSGTSTTALLEIRNLNTEPNGNDFALDDLYFGTPVFSSAIPEPGALALFLAGLAAIGFTRRKRSA